MVLNTQLTTHIYTNTRYTSEKEVLATARERYGYGLHILLLNCIISRNDIENNIVIFFHVLLAIVNR